MHWYQRLFRRARTERQLDAEPRFHLEQQVADYVATGMTPEEARRRARLEKDLPKLLTFFDFPRTLGRQLRTANVIERCFVEVRRRTRPMVCFVNVESVDRIIYAIFNGYNEQHQWRNRTLRLFTQAA
jgi:transposase-like protein